MIFINCQVKFSTESSTGNGYDATAKIRNINLFYETDLLDITQEGSSFKQIRPTLKNWGATLTFNHDYLDDKITDKLWTYFNSSGSYITIRPSTFSKITRQPRYHGSFLMESFPFLSGSVGELSLGQINILGIGSLKQDEIIYLVTDTTEYLVTDEGDYIIGIL